MDLNHQSDWQRIFNGRQYELQELINIWQAVKTGEPQLAVVLGETGLGKTRLVQELFTHISKPDTDDPNGYWPDTLNVGRNLALDVAPHQLNAEVDLPFLWWPMRFTANDDRNQTTVISPFEQIPRELAMHSEPYKRMLERYSADKRVAKELVSVLEGVFTSLADGILLGGAIGTSMSLIEMMKERQRNKQLNQDVSITDLLLERTREAVAQTIARLRLFFTVEGDAKRCPTIPVILVIDDAQWSDPVTLFSLMLIFFEAREHNWPLMVICTHWEKEWNESDDLNHQLKDLLSSNKEDLNKGEIGQVFSQLPATLSLKQVYSVFQSFDSNSGHLIPLKKLDDMMLKNVAQKALPGIKSSEVRQLVVEAGGNPRAMEEMLRRLLDKPKKYFINADSQSSLSPAGERALAQLKNTTLYQKVFDRFDDLDYEVQILLSTGALYGVQFIRPLVLDLINHKEEVLTEDQLAPLADDAQNLYVLIQKLTERSDSFQQSLYRKVAEEHLKEDDEQSYTQYKSNIAKVYARWLVPEKYQELNQMEQEQLFAMVLDYAFQSQEVQLLTPSQIGHIFDTLLAMLKGRHQYPQITLWWSKMLDQQSKPWFIEVISSLESSTSELYAALNESSDLREPVVQLINSLEPLLDSQRFFDIKKRIHWYAIFGDIEYRNFGDEESVEKANFHYLKGFELAKKEIEDNGETPDLLWNISVAQEDAADLAVSKGDMGFAGRLYEESLGIRRRLVSNSDNTHFLIGLSSSLERMANFKKIKGDVDTAEKLYRESLDIRENCMSEFANSPGYLEGLASCLSCLAELVSRKGDISAAEKLYDESFGCHRIILNMYGNTPARLSNLSHILLSSADLARTKGDMDVAAGLFEESLQVRRRILSDYGHTPERLRDLSIGLLGMADIVKAKGDIETAATLYEDYLRIRRRILSDYGDTPDRLRGLAVGLERISDMALNKGDTEVAEKLNQECLQVYRRLLSEFGVTPDRLRDLSIGLEKQADIANKKCETNIAVNLYRDASQIWRGLLSDYGHTPERLRGLAVTLVRLAELAKNKGDLVAAGNLYEEYTQVNRMLLSDYDVNPDRLTSFSISLVNYSDLVRIQGKMVAAEDLFLEALQVNREILSEFGATEERLDLMFNILDHKIRILWNDDVFPKEAKIYLLEAQEILNRSIQLYGETPQREQSLMDIDARIMAIKYRFVMRPIGILMRPFIKKWRTKQ